MQDLSSLTRDWTHTLGSENTKPFLTTELPEKSQWSSLDGRITRFLFLFPEFLIIKVVFFFNEKKKKRMLVSFFPSSEISFGSVQMFILLNIWEAPPWSSKKGLFLRNTTFVSARPCTFSSLFMEI